MRRTATALIVSLALVLATIVVGAWTAQPAETPVASVAHWEGEFRDHEPRYFAENLDLSTSSDSWDYYDLAYGIDAFTSMYEATGKRRYAVRALTLVQNTVNRSRPVGDLHSQFHDGYRGWVSQRSDVRGDEVPLFESYAWRYVTRLLRVVRQSPTLFADDAIRAQYRRLLSFSETNIFAKWYSRGAADNIYRSRTHMAAHWAYIAVDLAVLTRDQQRRQRYLTVFRNINRDLPNYDSSLRQQMRESPVISGAYFWDDTWASHDRPGQDVAHGNGVISYLVEANAVGREWTVADMGRLVRTFDRVVWPRAGRGHQYIDGSGTGTGWFADGFVKLGRFSPALQRRLEAHQFGQSLQFFASLAANARVLRAPARPTSDKSSADKSSARSGQSGRVPRQSGRVPRPTRRSGCQSREAPSQPGIVVVTRGETGNGDERCRDHHCSPCHAQLWGAPDVPRPEHDHHC